MSVNSFTKHEPLIFKTGSNIKLIHRAEYCKSIIADGKELITGNERGKIRVPELKDPKVNITFKEDLTSLANAFSGCSALKSIPENLFANCPEVTDFSYTFEGCSALKSIPENLFVNNPEVIKFYGTFSGCKALTEIPENLFASNPAVTDFSSTFIDCSALTTIPENLFASNPAVTDFSFTFSACSALKSIPENLFANNSAVTDFFRTFYGCLALKSIPSSLFDNNRKVTSFSFTCTFHGCSALTGESPYTMIDGQKVHLYERADYPEHFTAPTGFQDCFYECTKLTDYAQIPSGWKE